ncbi:glycosyltransferase [Arthrobacter sp. PM3]|uniref:glycosyltransferase n=1 Tax=Arthrobacter sp. PM3 TaxID=2017685 RepID=UPI000E101ACD|nr:glycosyltransferase [Arthrobacter sp. PM3]AXJ09295.1 hypothetical protein CFN17_06435 [Arthrobacter sp. PM3]
MRTDVDHVILTRFNLPSEGAESTVRAKEGWLRTRVELFERYCLPSVENQTVRSFNWVIYFDPQSPEWLKARIDKLSRGSVFTPIYRARVSQAELVTDLRAVTGAKAPRLLTTNLDNDDGLASDFVARLQQVPVGEQRAAIYLVHGLIRSGTGLYLRTDRANAFCSVQEDWHSAQTCWADWHNLLGRTMNVIEIGGDPAWLQVIHGTNVSNRIRGRLTTVEAFEPLFGALLDGAVNPGRAALARDLLVARPGRYARDLGREALKRAAMSVLGKEGIDRLKAEWASRPVQRNQVSR